MASFSNPILKEVFKFLDESFNKKSNSVILTIPGLGLHHILSQYAAKYKANYINDFGQDTGVSNIIDFDFYKDSDCLKKVDAYYKSKRSISPKNTFVFVINTPFIINSFEYQNSYLASHIYKINLFRAWKKDELTDFAKEQKVKVSNGQTKRTEELSGGIIRIAKYLLFHLDLLDTDIKEYAESGEFKKLMKPTLDVIAETPFEILEKMGIVVNGNFVSPVIRWFFDNKKFEVFKKIDIKIEPDMVFYEDGERSIARLTKSEADILRLLLSKEVATRDEIADVKWEKESYDKFSDQAINQEISRINSKLKKYKVSSISKVGYKLEKLNDR